MTTNYESIEADLIKSMADREENPDTGRAIRRALYTLAGFRELATDLVECRRQLADEQSRHTCAVLKIEAEIAALRATCTHPLVEVNRGTLAGESYRECRVCGSEVNGASIKGDSEPQLLGGSR